jgi:hypothetical protein
MIGCFSFFRRPYVALVLAATLGVAWQMYPIVFGGRSLVSPDNGPVLLLYEKMPTLPGYTKPEGDDSMGADVGALMWAHMPYSAVQHKAIFEHHEWPLWDRYNLCGIPLLGQGQILLGNPLHALVIAADSADWAWDLEFVLTRWLFAFTLGVAALLFGAGLAGAVALAFSASFIGLFAYYYNHPAIFSVAYAPLILVAWAGIVRGRSPRALAAWLGLLLLGSLMELTSGTAKEAVVLMLGMHATGALMLLRSGQSKGLRGRKLLVVGATGVIFVLLTAPHWITFLTVLKQSQTSYDAPGAVLNSPWQIVGLFDDMFFRELQPKERHGMPAANFLALLGVGWGLLRFRVLPARRTWTSLAFATGATAALVYGLVPTALLVRLPFLANIHHIDKTFSCVLVVQVLLLAAFGWRQLLRDLGQPGYLATHVQFVAGVAVLVLLYFAFATKAIMSPFFVLYLEMLMLAVMFWPGVAGWLAQLGWRRLAHALLAVGAVLCLWRHGEYGPHKRFNDYVVNPGQRVNLRLKSQAMDLVKRSMTEPFRVLGLGLNLCPGYGAMYGVETIYGVDALRNRRIHELMAAYDFRRAWMWEKLDTVSSVPARARLRDSLGIRYYLGTSGSRRRPSGVRLLANLDMDVFERPEAWPRAFFTDAVLMGEGAPAVAGFVNSGDGHPLAVLAPDDRWRVPGAQIINHGTASRTVNPAFAYQLAENDITFKVNATGPGVVVLGETYYPDAFQVRLDGRTVPYFPVNHAFKGIFVEYAGEHIVTFRYRGQHFGLSLHLAQAGLVLMFALFLALLLLPGRWLSSAATDPRPGNGSAGRRSLAGPAPL